MSITDIFSAKDINKVLHDLLVDNSIKYKIFFREIGLTDKTKSQIEKVFDALDTDNDGFIVENDFKRMLKIFKSDARELTAAEAKDFMKAGDPNNKGKMGLDDFIAMVESAKHQD